MISKTTHASTLRISSAVLALMLLLSACNVTSNTPTLEPTATLPEPVGAVSTATPAGSEGQNGPQVTVDVSGVAQDVVSQVIPAVPPSADGPWWAMMPQYTLLTLQGYPLSGTLMQPQIFVYRVNDLGDNEVAMQVAESLQTLLQGQQEGQVMPYLPPYNAAQVMHAQVKYLDFKNGTGVRYLTQFDQAVLPINNHELHYTYQGLTNDGKYYVAAVLPVNLPSLPVDEIVTENPEGFITNFPQYLQNTVIMLNQQPASAFTPDLSQLDALVQSIEVK